SSISLFFFFSSRRRHTRFSRDWSSDVCSSDLDPLAEIDHALGLLEAAGAVGGVAGAVVQQCVGSQLGAAQAAGPGLDRTQQGARSEERRVGKEGRSRWAPEQ